MPEIPKMLKHANPLQLHAADHVHMTVIPVILPL